MRKDLHEHRWSPWFAWRTVFCNTDTPHKSSTQVFWEWVYRAKRIGFDGHGIMSNYTYLTKEAYDAGKWDNDSYEAAVEKCP